MSAYTITISLDSRNSFRNEESKKLIASLSKPESIFQALPNHTPAPISKRRDTLLNRKKRDYRFGPIRIDWIDFEEMSAGSPVQKEKSKDWNTSVAVFEPSSSQTAGTTNLPEGIVHIFKESPHVHASSETKASTSKPSSSTLSFPQALPQGQSYGENSNIVAVLAVPAWMTPSDFLAFVAPAADTMKHLRLVRDVSPNRTMVIIQFKQHHDAVVFIEEFNGHPFNSIEPEICNVVRVSSVKVEEDDPITLTVTRTANSSHASGSYELPTCPVCLDRMDATVTGLVTVPCSHTFHCTCLSKWGDSRCPVCRYSQLALSSTSVSPSGESVYEPPPSGVTSCSDCDSRINLWICLICGNIGCGRQGRAHAKSHYELTTHLYAMELETQRVWDYAGDNYVHRLIQNKADGKLVELPPAAGIETGNANGRRQGPGEDDNLKAEKMEIMAMQYSQILQRAMDDQRATYEEQSSELKRKLEDTQRKLEILSNDFDSKMEAAQEVYVNKLKESEDQRSELEKDKVKAERKVEKLTELSRKLHDDLKTEKAITEGLMKNMDSMKKKIELADNEKKELSSKVSDLEDQMRDVMFFLEAREKIEKGGEVIGEAAGGSIVVQTPPTPRSVKKKKKGG
ncbi:zf-UBP-domain-containing protein [Schizopora paradoxa]|uniref:Zf-UBP-domain-containing protein n=1 Tax=Schizopora paradoxa TaxID=27342 RepID=A0A0H2S5P3_9AGAM|nr:zf-UBP-domain-containing protein [Schizopora paradoxa]